MLRVRSAERRKRAAMARRSLWRDIAVRAAGALAHTARVVRIARNQRGRLCVLHGVGRLCVGPADEKRTPASLCAVSELS